MSEKERIEKAVERRQRKNIRKDNIIKTFRCLAGKYHFQWLYELTEKYKSLDEYPFIPCRDLALMYSNNLDRTIAAFMGFSIMTGGGYEGLHDAMEEMGERPWEWFVNRGFVRLSVGDMQNQKTGWQWNWKIAQVFQCLYGLYTNSECASLADAVLTGASQTLTPLDKYLSRLLEDCGVGELENRLHMLIMVLSAADGIGLSIWPIMPVDVRCPLTRRVVAFLRLWWPNYQCGLSAYDAISAFGFPQESDFFIASLAYWRLRESRPDECKKYEKRFQRYLNGSTLRHNDWKGVLPKIEF